MSATVRVNKELVLQAGQRAIAHIDKKRDELREKAISNRLKWHRWKSWVGLKLPSREEVGTYVDNDEFPIHFFAYGRTLNAAEDNVIAAESATDEFVELSGVNLDVYDRFVE